MVTGFFVAPGEHHTDRIDQRAPRGGKRFGGDLQRVRLRGKPDQSVRDAATLS